MMIFIAKYIIGLTIAFFGASGLIYLDDKNKEDNYDKE